MKMTVLEAKKLYDFGICELCGNGNTFAFGNGVEGPCRHCEAVRPDDEQEINISMFVFHITDMNTNEHWTVKIPLVGNHSKLNKLVELNAYWKGIDLLKVEEVAEGAYNGFLNYEYAGDNLYFFCKVL